MTNLLNLEGKVALVTGGTRGIGRAVARRLAEAGAIVAVCARKMTAAEEGVSGLHGFVCDVRKYDQVQQMMTTVLAQFGRLDIIVNNAGGSPEISAAAASARLSEAIIGLNLIAALHVSQAANAVMQAQETGGSIVNIASISGTRPSPGTAAYGAAKAGLLNLTQTLAMEWGPKVRVNAVVAGLIHTDAADDHYGAESGLARIAEMLPMGRLGTPADIADAVLYLSSPLAAYVSGAQLSVHGGGERPSFLMLAKGDAHAPVSTGTPGVPPAATGA